MDGVSDCGDYAVSVIAFIGSVFSPWYRWSGRKRPENHCCINVATYGRGGRFAMTDRGEGALRQTADSFTVGPSALYWTGEKLIIDINEVSSLPLVSRMRGTIEVIPTGISDVELPLTEDGTHVWRPIAPTARIKVDLGGDWTWDGHGYFDANFGTRALEQDFDYWTWARYPVPGGSVCFYDATRRDGSELAIGVGFSETGEITPIDTPPLTRVPRSLWAVRRETRADKGYAPRQTKAMLDAPFYTRSVVRTKINGHVTEGVHEALDLNRFRGPWLMPMLAVRVPRRPVWDFGD
ncbi:MAG: carotenoid 1,2-hydratase [Paracoccaceae bacterium]|nr:carotenoid 1,2-hydratase [Paracoccaceae bacterium]